MRCDARVGSEQLGEWTALDKGGLRGVVDNIVSMLPANLRAEIQHYRLGHNEPATQIEVLAHTGRIELEPLQDLDEAGERVAQCDCGARLGGLHHQACRAVGL